MTAREIHKLQTLILFLEKRLTERENLITELADQIAKLRIKQDKE